MATEIGIIKALVGTATATSTDGTIRTLQIGDKVYQNDLITTGAAAAVEVEFADGSTMDMGRSTQAILDVEVFDPSASTAETTQPTEVTDDIAAIQQALLDGEDPTVAGEATAAGAGAGEGSEGGHDFVVRDYLNPEVTPESGFETTGPGQAFIQNEEDLNDLEVDGIPTAGLTEVLLDEDDLVTDGEVDLSNVSDEFQDYLESIGLYGFRFESPAGVGDERPEIGDDVGSPDGYFLGGNLVANFGSNGPHPTTPIVFNVTSGTNVTDADGNPVTSQGQQVQYWVSADGLTVIGYIGNGFGEGPGQGCGEGEGEGAQVVFTIQLTPTATGGEFLVGIFAQFDHASPDYENGEFVFENNLFINLGFTITDFDGDSATGTLQLNVDDDSPVRAGDEEQGLSSFEGVVQEGALSFENGNLSDGNLTGFTVTSEDSDATQSDIESFLGLPTGALDAAADSNTTDGGEAVNGSATQTTITAYAGDIITFTWSFDQNEDGGEFNDFAFIVINGEVIELADVNGNALQPNPFTYEVPADGEVTIGFGQMNVGDSAVDSSLSVSGLTLNGEPIDAVWDSLGNVTDTTASMNTLTGDLNSLVNMGADGPGEFALLQPSENPFVQAQYEAAMASLPTLSSKGEAVTYEVITDGDSSILVATAGEGDDAREVFTLEVTSDGEWIFTLNDQLDHVAGEGAEANFNLITLDENGEPNGFVEGIDFTLLLSIRDFDGDYLILSQDDAGMFTIRVQDDIPVVGDNSADLDDGALPGGTPSAGGETTVSGTIDASVGADEEAEFSFAPMDGQTGMAGTEMVTYELVDGVLTATITGGDRDGQVLFTATLDPETGDYTVELVTNVLHESLDGLEGDNTENNAEIELKFSVKDADGDTVNGSLIINVRDDIPTIPKASINEIQETDVDNNGFDVKSIHGQLLFNAGADGAEVTAVNIANSVDFQGLTSDGEAVVVADSSNPNEVIVNSVDGDPVFKLTVNPDGTYTFTQYRELDHVGRDEALIKLGFNFTVTDGDGDTADGILVISVKDDVPTIDKATTNTIKETDIDNNGFDVKSVNGQLLFNPGADGAEVTAVNITNSVDFQGLTSGGETVIVADSSNPNEVVVTTEGGETVFTLTVNPDGTYKFTQYRELDHVGRDEALIKLGFEFTVTDGDGDTADGILVIGVEDDVPVFTQDSGITITHDESAGAQDEAQQMSPMEIFFKILGGANPLDLNDDGRELFTQHFGDGQMLGVSVKADTSGITYNAGADGIGNVALTDAAGNNFNGTATGMHTSADGQPIYLYSLSGALVAAVAQQLADLGINVDLGNFDLFGDNIVIGLTNDDGLDQYTSIADMLADAAFLVGLIEGSAGDGSDDLLALIQLKALQHGDTESHNESISLDMIHISITDGDGDTITSESTIELVFTDDGPTLDVTAVKNAIDQLAMTLDETVGADRAAEGESVNGNNDDVDGALAQVTTTVEGGLISLFNVTGSVGADGPGTLEGTLSLQLSSDGLATTLEATDGGLISLYNVDGKIVGRDENNDDVFTIEIIDVNGELQLQTTLHEAIKHNDTNSFDEALALLTKKGSLKLEYEVTRTDADGDSVTEKDSIVLSNKNKSAINFEDDGPAVIATQPVISVTIEVTNEGGDAGYNNTYGYYIKGENGEPLTGEIIWSNVKDNESDEVTIDADPADIGFFIIPNGFDLNEALENGAEVTFEKDTDGNWVVLLDGQPLTGQGANVLFNDPSLNPNGYNAVEDNSEAGNQNWEDIINGDNDHNDVNINVVITRVGQLVVDETYIGEAGATATVNLADSFEFDFGSDGASTDDAGGVNFSLSVDTDVETGLVDTLSGKPVELRVNEDGVVEGFITSDDGQDYVVFTVSVDDEGNVTLTQLRAVEHDDPTDHDEADSPATINEGALSLDATATDGDGDQATAGIDLGSIIGFKDDGPTIGEQAQGNVDEGQTTTGTLVFDAGQDGGGVTHINGIALQFGEDGYSQEIELEHGAIKVKANGEYSYSVDDSSVTQDEVENFSFTVTDGDGDTAQGNVAINIANVQVDVVITLKDVSVVEGSGQATISAKLDNPVTSAPLVITLSNGVTITIPVGSDEGISDPFDIQGDDPYIDNESYVVTVTGVTGGDFANVNSEDTATVTISDTIDTVIVKLTATESTSEDGGVIRYTATIEDAEGNPVATNKGVTVELENGETITIPAGESSGYVDVDVDQDDVYLGNDDITTAIESVTETDAGSQGAFEDLTFSDAEVSTEITDDNDAVIVKLTATESTSEDGGLITYKASLVDASGNPVTTNNAITVILENGEEIIIEANSSEGTVDVPVNRDDVFVEDDEITNAIESVTEDNAGADGAFENLQADTSEVSTTINDDVDTVTATLTATPSELSEDGGTITYKVTLTGGPGDIDPNTPVTFTLTNNGPDGQPITITINAGDLSGQVDVTYTAEQLEDQSSLDNSIGSVSGDAQYEDLQTAGETSVRVDTTPVISNLTPKALGGDVSVDEDDLSADRGAGESAGSDGSDSTTAQGSFNVSAADGIGNLTVGGFAVIINGVFVAGSYTTPLGNTLSFTGYNPATGEVAYQYTLNDNTLNHGPNDNGENSVFEDFAVELTDVDGDPATDTLSVQIVDDVPEIAPESFGTITDGSSTNGISLESLFGADGAGDIAFAESLNGSDVLQGGEQVFFNGEELTWELVGDVLTAKTESGVEAIKVTLNDADGTYDIEVADGTFYLAGDEQTFAIGDLSGSNADAWVAKTDGIDTLIISEGTSTNTSNAGGLGYVGAGSNWISAGESTTFFFYDNIDAPTGGISGQTNLDNALNSSVVAGVSSFAISVNTQGGAATTISMTFTAVDGTTGTLSVEVGSNGPANPYQIEVNASDIVWEGGAEGLAIASFEFEGGDVDYRVGGDLVIKEISPSDIDLDLPVTITDADGDTSEGNITGTITSDGVEAGVEIGDIPDELYVGNNGDNTNTTDGGNDVLIGDIGGRDQQYSPGKNYSIALIADESGSMEGFRNGLLKDALESFVNSLADHDGVINIALIGFAQGASLEISVSDLANNPNGLQDLLEAIDNLGANGGTNYEAAFDEAVEWFATQPNGHEFISYFMTDGDPTYSNGGSHGSGSSTQYEDLYDAVQAFQALSNISEVNAIGIGSGVNEDYLRFFDNTGTTGNGSESFGHSTVVLANFSGTNDPLDSLSNWTKTGDSQGSRTTQYGDFLTIRDARGTSASNNAATVLTSNVFAVALAGTEFTFQYSTYDSNNGDEFVWTLQKQNTNGSWSTVETEALARDDGDWNRVTSDPLDAGNYRVVYWVKDNSGSGNAMMDIDNIELRVPDEIVNGPVGEPQIINSAGELIAQLQEGNTTEGPVDLGDDVLEGGDGDDVIFGDTLYTDELTWTNDDTGEEFTAGHGLGYEGLVEYLTWEVYGGTAPTDDQIMAYIRDNYESLINPNPSQAEIDAAGDNILIGGAGDDILIGGLGADIFKWNAGDEGSEGSPAVDTVVNFNASEGDVLDISDLLNDPNASDSLNDYLVATYDNVSDKTTIEVYTNGNAGQAGAQSTQNIVVNGDQTDLNQLLSGGNLNVDNS